MDGGGVLHPHGSIRIPHNHKLSEEERRERCARDFVLASERHNFEGDSWTDATRDVVLPGIGWVAITVRGKVTLDIFSLQNAPVKVREPLMPYELRSKTAFFKQK